MLFCDLVIVGSNKNLRGFVVVVVVVADMRYRDENIRSQINDN